MKGVSRALAVAVLGATLILAGAVTAPVVRAQTDCPAVDRLSSVLELAPGIHREVQVPANIQRVAIGNPEVANLQLTSRQSFLVSTFKPGSTNISVWTRCGTEPKQIMLFVAGPATSALNLAPIEYDAAPSQVQLCRS